RAQIMRCILHRRATARRSPILNFRSSAVLRTNPPAPLVSGGFLLLRVTICCCGFYFWPSVYPTAEARTHHFLTADSSTSDVCPRCRPLLTRFFLQKKKSL